MDTPCIQCTCMYGRMYVALPYLISWERELSILRTSPKSLNLSKSCGFLVRLDWFQHTYTHTLRTFIGSRQVYNSFISVVAADQDLLLYPLIPSDALQRASCFKLKGPSFVLSLLRPLPPPVNLTICTHMLSASGAQSRIVGKMSLLTATS